MISLLSIKLMNETKWDQWPLKTDAYMFGLNTEPFLTENLTKEAFHYRVFKKMVQCFFLQISRQSSIGFANPFFLLKTEIHMQNFEYRTFFVQS